MQIVLLWHSRPEAGSGPDARAVAERLGTVFAPLFPRRAPRAHVLEGAAATLVRLELPVEGWLPAFFQEDERSWALAVDYPCDAAPTLAARGLRPADASAPLPDLCRAMEADPEPFLRELAPHFLLIWGERGGSAVHVQNDGLGSAQAFEYDDGRTWALSNKIFAFRALGLPLEIDAPQWALRADANWFPADATGIRRVRYLEPGTRIRIDHGGVQTTRFDVAREWMHPTNLAAADCLELARQSVQSQLRAARPLWERPSAGLTGGHDTRAVVATLLAEEAENVAVRVRGRPESYDVRIAVQLAEIAGLELGVETQAALPPAEPGALERRIANALLWQAGYVDFGLHKLFLAAHDDGLGGGNVNVMGSQGAIGKWHFTRLSRAHKLGPEEYEDRLVTLLTRAHGCVLRREFAEQAETRLRELYQKHVAVYGLEGQNRLHGFYLLEHIRRREAGGHYAQPGQIVAPFFNPDFIRAAFAYPDDQRTGAPFQDYIVSRCCPAWSGVPYLKELRRRERRRARRPWRRLLRRLGRGAPAGGARGKRWDEPAPGSDYDAALYWKTVGESLLREAFREGGAWTEVLDPDAARRDWDDVPNRTVPDLVATMYLFEKVLAGS